MSISEGQSASRLTAQQDVTRARHAVLGGRGPGASEEEILSQTRGKTFQAGVPVVRRLAVTARDSARARRPGSTFVDGGLVTDFDQSPDNPPSEASYQSSNSAWSNGELSPLDQRRRRRVFAVASLSLLAFLTCRRRRPARQTRTARAQGER